MARKFKLNLNQISVRNYREETSFSGQQMNNKRSQEVKFNFTRDFYEYLKAFYPERKVTKSSLTLFSW
jgi:hypothetical protein